VDREQFDYPMRVDLLKAIRKFHPRRATYGCKNPIQLIDANLKQIEEHKAV
jgi:hypothetical protein